MGSYLRGCVGTIQICHGMERNFGWENLGLMVRCRTSPKLREGQQSLFFSLSGLRLEFCTLFPTVRIGGTCTD